MTQSLDSTGERNLDKKINIRHHLINKRVSNPPFPHLNKLQQSDSHTSNDGSFKYNLTIITRKEIKLYVYYFNWPSRGITKS